MFIRKDQLRYDTSHNISVDLRGSDKAEGTIVTIVRWVLLSGLSGPHEFAVLLQLDRLRHENRHQNVVHDSTRRPVVIRSIE